MEFRQGDVLESYSRCFELEHEIGRGTYGVVWKAKQRVRNAPDEETSTVSQTSCGLQVAVKIFNSGKQYDYSGLQEAKLLQNLNAEKGKHAMEGSVHVVQLLDCFYCKGIQLCSVYELLDYSLHQILRKTGGCGLPVYVVHKCAMDLFNALAYLQQNGIIHGDIKLGNVMWSGDEGCFKLVDFGLSFTDGHQPHQAIQSCGYQAPEVQEWNRQLQLPDCEPHVNTELCCKESDTWSVGCVLVHLILGWPLYDSHVQHPLVCLSCQQGSQCTHESHVNTQLRKTLCDHTTTTADQLEALKDLLLKLLKCKPSDRITPADALQHQFITSCKRASLSDLLFLPTRVLQLCNMLDNTSELVESEEIKDIAIDIEEECKKYGDVNSIHIPTGTASKEESYGKVYVEFQRTRHCEEAQRELMGRTFNQRAVVASFFPLQQFFEGHFF